MHIKRIHQTDGEMKKTAICEFCAKSFVSSYQLRVHVKNKHTQRPPREQHQCYICQKWLGSAYTLKTHIQQHLSEPLECPHCHRMSPHDAALKKHIRVVHGTERFPCPMCGKAFKEASSLKVRAPAAFFEATDRLLAKI